MWPWMCCALHFTKSLASVQRNVEDTFKKMYVHAAVDIYIYIINHNRKIGLYDAIYDAICYSTSSLVS